MPDIHPVNTWVIAYIIIVVIIWAFYWWEKRNILTPEELDDYGDIMMHFYEEPNFDDFMDVYNNRAKLIKQNGRPTKYWLWGVYLKYPEFFNEKRIIGISEYTREITRGLRRVKTHPTPELLDCIWALYFATGETQYSDIIKEIAINCPDLSVSGAATWSFTSIIGVSPHTIEIVDEGTANPEPAQVPT